MPDPYFSATKLEWLLREHDPRELAFGTVDTWLVWKLTGGACTRPTRRTPRARSSARSTRSTGTTSCSSSSASRASCCPRSSRRARTSARASCSGTRCRSRASPATSRPRSSPPAARRRRTGRLVRARRDRGAGARRRAAHRRGAARGEPPKHALEGAVFVTGAAVQWLRDGLGLLDDAGESEALAASLDDNGGVYFVPALAGLGSPHWRADARGTITGLTRGTTRAHLVRAALEAAAYQTADVLDVMPKLDAATRRRRHDPQPLADAVPGRRARHPGRDGTGARADCARRRAARARRAPAVACGRALRAARRCGAPLRRLARGVANL